MIIGISSKGIVKIPFLLTYLKFDLTPSPSKDSAMFIGWGNKHNALKLKTKAIRYGIVFSSLEDGFLRSFSTSEITPTVSIVFDDQGIYYNSSCKSKLEFIIINLPISDHKKIFKLKNKILNFSLSKYNNFFNKYYLLNRIKSNVLVVDQTYGDLSVRYGGAYPQSFVDMLNAALLENPTATIYIKTHPEVTSGRKKGYLTHIQDSDRIVMIRDDVNPIDLIQKMDKVYVVTSQMGFEALMCEKPVVCFGVPWYAGWGVTDDRVIDSPAWARRTKKRTVDELFAAAYLHYTRYLNPFTHERGTIFDVIEWLVLQKKMVANQFKRAL